MSDFITKDSGERQTFSTGMVRDSGAKTLRPDLLPLFMVRRFNESTPFVCGDNIETLRQEAFESLVDWLDSDDGDAADYCLACIDRVERLAGRGAMVPRWAELMGRGALKYGERNWEKARTQEELDRFKASAFRHFLQWFYQRDGEEDHAAGTFFNIAGAEYVKARLEKKSAEFTITFDIDVQGSERLSKLISDLEHVAPAQTIQHAELPPAPRPFKVGDVLYTSDARITPRKVTKIEDGCFYCDDLSTAYLIEVAVRIGWVHADGTLIAAPVVEPPGDWPQDHVGPV